jgi:hypothetical protein
MDLDIEKALPVVREFEQLLERSRSIRDLDHDHYWSLPEWAATDEAHNSRRHAVERIAERVNNALVTGLRLESGMYTWKYSPQLAAVQERPQRPLGR